MARAFRLIPCERAAERRNAQAKINPMLWIGSLITVTVIGAFVSHIVTGTP